MRLLVLAIPTELAGGRYAVPAWVILALGGIVVASAAIVLALRFRRGRTPSEDPKEKP